MHEQLAISIRVDKPCRQSWEGMSETAHGRHCNECNKTVTDFTNWSNADLAQYFSRKPTGICGRFLNTQLHVAIALPYQPHSRLYHMTLALGLTLICTQTPAALAQNRPPKAPQAHYFSGGIKAGRATANQPQPANNMLTGHITDEQGQAMPYAKVELYQQDDLKSAVLTDAKGRYELPWVEGAYTLLAFYADCKPVMVKNAGTSQANHVQNITIDKRERYKIMVSGAPEAEFVDMRPEQVPVKELKSFPQNK